MTSATNPTITNGYATLDQFKARYIGTGAAAPAADTMRDFEICDVIMAVSRMIDAVCSRNFWQFSTVDETRYYTPQSTTYCAIDDLQSITSLATDSDVDGTYATVWAAKDYWLSPVNAEVFTYLERTPRSDYMFLGYAPRFVKVVGKFGYTADGTIPEIVHEACMLMSNRIWLRKGAPFGVIESPGTGMLSIPTRLDPDIERFLAPVTRNLIP